VIQRILAKRSCAK